MDNTMYPPETIAKALTDAHGLVSHAAKLLGCCQNTVRKAMKAHPEVNAAREDAREAMKDLGEAALFKAVSAGEGWAVCFYLKCQARDRGYIEKQAMEHSGPAGGVIQLAWPALQAVTATTVPEAGP
jgi:hypothetical protein